MSIILIYRHTSVAKCFLQTKATPRPIDQNLGKCKSVTVVGGKT